MRRTKTLSFCPSSHSVSLNVFMSFYFSSVRAAEGKELKLWNWHLLMKSTISATWRNYLMMMDEKVFLLFYKKSLLFSEKKYYCKLFCKCRGKKLSKEITEVCAICSIRHVFAKWPECHNLASYQMFFWIFDNFFWENAKITNFLMENVQLW